MNLDPPYAREAIAIRGQQPTDPRLRAALRYAEAVDCGHHCPEDEERCCVCGATKPLEEDA